MGSFDEVSHFMIPLASQNPGVASLVGAKALGNWGAPTNVPLPTVAEIGLQFRTAMQAWCDGLGDLDRYIAPVYPDGSLGSVGMAEWSGRVTVSWYTGDPRIDPVAPLPTQRLLEPWPAGWHGWRSAAPPSQPAWPWGWTHEKLVEALSAWLKGEPKFLPTSAPIRERTWKVALQIVGKGDNWPQPLPPAELEALVKAAPIARARLGT